MLIASLITCAAKREVHAIAHHAPPPYPLPHSTRSPRCMQVLTTAPRAFAQVPLYVPPPTFESLPSLRELRRTHRNGLQPRALPCDGTVRWMPEPFDAEMQSPADEIGAPATGSVKGHVLEAISPLLYLEEASSGDSSGGGGGGGGGAQQLALPPLSAHAAAKSVVAKKMLSRLDSDLRWLSEQNRTAAKPWILRGFGSAGSGATEMRRKVVAELGRPHCA